MRILIFSFLFLSSAYAQVLQPQKPEPTFEQIVNEARPIKEAEVKVIEKDPTLVTTRDFRAVTHHTLSGGYEFLSSWIPSKLKASYTYTNNPDWSFELEHAYGSWSSGISGIDLGKVTEKRTTFLAHRYIGNSFHFDFGPYYYQLEARAGGKALKSLPSTSVADFGVNGLGLAAGIGNRWQWKNGFTFGVDWIRLNIPFLETQVKNEILKNISNQSNRDDVKKVIGYFGHVPTFVLLGISLGYSF
jgi:hypothetical protein